MASCQTTNCCGILELIDISTEQTPEGVLKAVMKEIRECTTRSDGTRKVRPFIYFSGVVDRVCNDHVLNPCKGNYGQALADYIIAQGLGQIVATPEAQNWTENMLKMWVWLPDYTTLAEWHTAHQHVEDVSHQSFAVGAR